MPGVHAILSLRDHMDISWYDEKLPLFGEVVRFVGDEVAVVAAETPELAEDALRCIRVVSCGPTARSRSRDTGGLRIGALTTLSELEDSRMLVERHPMIAQAVQQIATPQLRNRAMVGGNPLQRPRCWCYRSEEVDCWLENAELGADLPRGQPMRALRERWRSLATATSWNSCVGS